MSNRQQDRQVWTVHGETALLGWKFLCDRQFAPIREAAGDVVPPVDLTRRVARHLYRFDVRTNRSRQGIAESLARMERTYGPLPDLSLRDAVTETAWRWLPAWARDPIKSLRYLRQPEHRQAWMRDIAPNA